MSILFSGDFHANVRGELSIITKESLLYKYGCEKYSQIQYHIILGDGGFMWQYNHKTDIKNYKVLACRPFPVLCVIGNHEPILGMKSLSETDIGIGETVYQINDVPFVAYLKRGKVYTIDGIKFLVLGGALSVDKDSREPNKTWWKLEYWTEQEKHNVFKLLENNGKFDCVVSHTGHNLINRLLFEHEKPYSEKFTDKVAHLNDKIHNKIQFREWLCGHWHEDRYYFNQGMKRGYHYLYRTTKIIEKVDDKLTIFN